MKDNKVVDEYLDMVLRASGSSLKNYTMQKTLDEMREAIRKIMSDSYIAGSNATYDILMGKK